MDKDFVAACNKVIQVDRERRLIGTLGEKTIHAVLKHYLEPREEFHECKCCGYYADILCDKNIIEIQTRSFDRLRSKLKAFLPEYEVTIVYPIPYRKWLIWINDETGEESDKRKSPKKGTPYQILQELYKVKEFLKDPNLRLCLIFLDMEEYRLLNGWSRDKKKGSTRYDGIPIEVVDEVYVKDITEYNQFIPKDLPENFTSKDYQKATKLSLSRAQTALNVLSFVGAVERIGKQGNAIIYQKAVKIEY